MDGFTPELSYNLSTTTTKYAKPKSKKQYYGLVQCVDQATSLIPLQTTLVSFHLGSPKLGNIYGLEPPEFPATAILAWEFWE